MPISKKQGNVRKKKNKERIIEIEKQLTLPIIDKVKKADLEYELARLKKNQ